MVHERFDVERIRDERDVTLVSLVPTQLLRLLDAGVDLGRFRAVLLGGAMAPPALLARAAASGATVVTTYGMSETSGGCVYDGLPLDGVAVRIGEQGRVKLAGPMLMSATGWRPTAPLRCSRTAGSRPTTSARSRRTGGWSYVHHRSSSWLLPPQRASTTTNPAVVLGMAKGSAVRTSSAVEPAPVFLPVDPWRCVAGSSDSVACSPRP